MKLFETYQLGQYTLKNRMVMAAMTRSRAKANGTPSELMVEYYRQRASAGLILSEAINISADAVGSPLTPSIYTDEHIVAWRKITDAVHAAGGVIFAQLWHTGRVAHSVERGGILPVAPSAVKIENMPHFTSKGIKDFEIPRALTTDEIQQTIEDYVQAAKNAIDAGFDGVQLHAANGYLPNQFLADNTNLRTDEYGGDIAGKSRFILETMRALIAAVGGDRVAIKLSPLQPYGDILLDNPVATYQYLFSQLNQLDFAFVELMKRTPSFALPAHYPQDDEITLFASMIHQPLIANGGYSKELAEQALISGVAALVSFGALFLANPDLPQRFAQNAELNTPDKATMFGGGEQGYIDYPFLHPLSS